MAEKKINKVFGIGLSRTGTTSLGHALTCMGFPCAHNPVSLPVIAIHPASVDITVACQFEQLDKLFPGSLFIYTEREMERWLDSCKQHFTGEERMSRLASGYATDSTSINASYLDAELRIYGQIYYNRNAWKEAYLTHQRRVESYFHGRDDLLAINIEDSPSSVLWESLRVFLGFEELPFPRLNASK